MAEKNAVLLLVEDSREDAMITQQALKQAGLEQRIVHVADGEEAINYLQGEPPFVVREDYPLPALVLLDLKMPKVTGLEVLAWLQSHPDLAQKIPVIVLTGSIHPRDRSQAHELGALGYEVKPVNFRELVAIAASLKERITATGFVTTSMRPIIGA